MLTGDALFLITTNVKQLICKASSHENVASTRPHDGDRRCCYQWTVSAHATIMTMRQNCFKIVLVITGSYQMSQRMALLFNCEI